MRAFRTSVDQASTRIHSIGSTRTWQAHVDMRYARLEDAYSNF